MADGIRGDRIWVATGYRFFTVDAPEILRSELESLAADADLLGTILVAGEGVNLSLAGSARGLDAFEAGLVARCGALPLQRSPAGDRRPFRRLRVRLRPEIVALGRPDDPFDYERASRVDAAFWESLIDDPQIPVIDVRNAYEVAVGRFEGAIDPGTDSFRAFPEWVETHLDPAQTPAVAIYCTGGIRCTKAAAWMRARGFREVHELDGGILGYLAARPDGTSRWRGDCFVFDDRVGLAAGLEPGDLRLCSACGQPVSGVGTGPDGECGGRAAGQSPTDHDLDGCTRSDCPGARSGRHSKETHA